MADPAPSSNGGPAEGQGNRLESWKEIAAYLGRDVTTVQRWERREGLPVHRLVHSKIGSIYAFTGELEAWRRARSRQVPRRAADDDQAPAPDDLTDPSSPDTHAAAGVASSDAALLLPSPFPPAEADSHVVRPEVPAWAATAATLPADAGAPREGTHRAIRIVAAVVLVVAIVGMLAWALRRSGSGRSGSITSVAVLPLRNLSGDAAQEYFADGMTEAVIARLANAGDLRVTSRTSVMQFKNVDKPIPEIAKALNAQAVLEGSVARSGNRVRVIAQLIDGATDAHLWAGEFDREVRDVLVLQSELAQAIARQISATLREPKAQATGPVSSDAYEHYLKGRYLLNESTTASIQQSVKEFQEAIAADPRFAPAHAGLASAHTDLGTVLIGAAPGQESVARAIAAANDAVTLDPNLAEGYSVLGRALMGEWRWAEAEAAFRRSLDLNPSDARTHIWFAEWLVAHDRLDEAAASALKARDLDPLSMRVGAEVGLVLGFARRTDDAVRQLRSVLAIEPDHVQASWWLANNLVDQGHGREAVDLLEHAAALSRRSPGVLSGLARAYRAAGRTADAKKILAELEARRESGFVPPASLAQAAMGAGERDKALHWLEVAADEKANALHLLRASGAMADVRDDPRLLAVYRRMGLR